MMQEWKCRTKMHPAKRDTVAMLPKTIDIQRMGGARSNECNNYFRYWHL